MREIVIPQQTMEDGMHQRTNSIKFECLVEDVIQLMIQQSFRGINSIKCEGTDQDMIQLVIQRFIRKDVVKRMQAFALVRLSLQGNRCEAC